MKTLVKRFAQSKMFWPLIALICIIIINLILIPGFFDIKIYNGHLFGSPIDILNRMTPLLIISLGMTLVIAKEGIDISVGSVLAISATTAATLIQSHSIFIALLAAIGVGVLCGIWNGVLVAYIGVNPMVGTLILMTVGRGIAQLISNGQIITVHSKAYHFIGAGYLLGFPFSVFVAVVCFILLYFLMRKTAMGLFLEAVGGNQTSSRFAGINVKKIMFIVYVVSGICAAIAGILISSNVNSADANNAGLWIELDAILAVVIGGTSMSGGRFYLGGTVVAALFIQTITTTIYTMGIPPETVMVAKAVIVIIVCLLQSNAFREMFMRKKAVEV
ncbi:monosaccharide ABC transporter membrane protein (CUT2 family) [Scopulibacillus darangshiensis]|uniref:Monosaccharide ABC transporter membrane protein (CUT2 family) n=1 Tax=Scopulibacillus darangshiensis TaxID=442528 RepID=A0A4R2P601_9BACL|nr:ABC transporter permease [Scopulibacillus darangshiensis]TCP29564.1 monosaccharide ABC transporter membrane protein (CUT2 family) [Scopulibacillus darangshiensis]